MVGDALSIFAQSIKADTNQRQQWEGDQERQFERELYLGKTKIHKLHEAATESKNYFLKQASDSKSFG